MSPEELVSQEWLLNKDNGLIFLVHPLLQINSNFSAYSPSVEEIIAGCKLTATVPVPALDTVESGTIIEDDIVNLSLMREIDPAIDRSTAIKTAVLSVAVGDYAAPAFGRPAMPKVAYIKEATGYPDVTADEIIAILSEEEAGA